MCVSEWTVSFCFEWNNVRDRAPRSLRCPRFSSSFRSSTKHHTQCGHLQLFSIGRQTHFAVLSCTLKTIRWFCIRRLPWFWLKRVIMTLRNCIDLKAINGERQNKQDKLKENTHDDYYYNKRTRVLTRICILHASYLSVHVFCIWLIIASMLSRCWGVRENIFPLIKLCFLRHLHLALVSLDWQM